MSRMLTATYGSKRTWSRCWAISAFGGEAEVGRPLAHIEVDTKSKRTLDGSNFAAIFPLGLVPLLRLDDGSLLSENAAIFQYIANRLPRSRTSLICATRLDACCPTGVACSTGPLKHSAIVVGRDLNSVAEFEAAWLYTNDGLFWRHAQLRGWTARFS